MTREHIRFAMLLFAMIVIVYCAGIEVGSFMERAAAARRASRRLIAKVQEIANAEGKESGRQDGDTEESQD